MRLTKPTFYKLLILFIWFNYLPGLRAQDSLYHQLNQFATELPALHKTVSVSVSNLNLGELVRLVTQETGVNIYIPQQLNNQVSSNFSGVEVKDIIYYLCKEYQLNMEIVGNIVRLTSSPQPEPIEALPDITVNSEGLISYHLQNIPLYKVCAKITDLTGINVTPSPSLKDVYCSGYGKDLGVEDALSQLGFGHGFSIKKVNDLQLILLPLQQDMNQQGAGSYYPGLSSVPTFMLDEKGCITQSVKDADLEEVFISLAKSYNLSYKLLNPIEGVVNIELTACNLEESLYRVFKGTPYTYKIEDGICFAGSRENSGLKTCRLVELMYRSAESLNKNLPQSYLMGIEWVEFIDNNSIILYGDSDKVHEFSNFIKGIDKRVPLVLIDVIIAEVSKTVNLEIMLDLGIGKTPVQTAGKLSPGIDMTFNSSSINKALDRAGLKSIGQITPNFYAKIKALEEDGILSIRSTPRLSTLNAKEASMSIGKTEYYLEKTNSFIGSLEPSLNVQENYKPITAEMSIKLRPIISGDGSITVSVEVNQSDFTERIDKFAPPGVQARKFKSEIRVLNNEMILLGGLEEISNKQSHSGLPFFSRIPIIRWFFSSSSKQKKDYQLTIFIRPTIIN